jgi:restriction endonuclease S subunit
MTILDKESWTAYKIGAVAVEINERILNPLEAGCEKFIRPEDLKVGELYVKTYRNPDDVGSGKYCYKGDILFARRSVSVSQFKKRSSIIKFDAVCSDEITVIRQNHKDLVPELLNLVLNTKRLWDFAIARSVGSVSKRIKWEDLASYEFRCPVSLKDQRQLVSLFQSLEGSLELLEIQGNNLLQLKNKLLKDIFNKNIKTEIFLSQLDYEKLRFEKIAKNISERVEPKKTELDIYVGLEHLKTDSLKIESTGSPNDVIGTKLKVSKGDIIFGKRRAYLRKIAVSHFDGIASAHSMVLRANEKFIEKDFLPFFMQSDVFMSRAVEISEGSLSPTIKNKTLAQQEFFLPKITKQKPLIEIFQLFDSLRERIQQEQETLNKLKFKLLEEILG